MCASVSIDQNNETCVRNFLEEVWNQKELSALDNYLHSRFVDHSMPYKNFQNKVGLRLYLKALKEKVHHFTVINNLISCQDLVIAEISIYARQTGSELRAKDEILKGIRLFKMDDNLIREHWEFLD